MANPRMTRTAVPFRSVTSRMAGGLETITGAAYGDSLPGAASRAGCRDRLRGGITGGAAGFPGAAVTIWCGFKGWDKTRQRALFQPFILLMRVAALLAINLVRPAAAHGLGMAMGARPCIPASLLVTAVGLTFFRGLSDTQFTRAVNLPLIVSGLSHVV